VTDARLFISMASGAQAAARAGRGRWKLHSPSVSVARYPVPLDGATGGDREAARGDLGIDPETFLILRYGRPDSAKWSDWECRAFQKAAAGSARPMRLLLMEPPESLARAIAAGRYGGAIAVRRLEASRKRVLDLVAASDLLLHAARFGESFGYSIAEAMAAGKPVVTRTTPWADNAQVELVEHGRTGFVCSGVGGMAAAISLLARDADLAEALGAAARQRMRSLCDPDTECGILEAALLDNRDLFDRRRAELELFRETFREREWNVIERTHRGLPGISRFAWVAGRWGSAVRMSGKRLSAIRADLRSSLGFPAYG